MTEKSLKAQYQKWLWSLVVADFIFVLFLVFPGVPSADNLTTAALRRFLTATVVPVAVLLVVNVLPHKVKCMLVYWKPYGWLPGCEVFTKYGPHDPRVDMVRLAANVGPLPSSPKDQNARWYQLYKAKANEVEVAEAHKLFLMYRDMATITVFLIPLVPLALYYAHAPVASQWIAAVALLGQYVVTSLSARHSGIRFVTNVIAVHSA